MGAIASCDRDALHRTNAMGRIIASCVAMLQRVGGVNELEEGARFRSHGRIFPRRYYTHHIDHPNRAPPIGMTPADVTPRDQSPVPPAPPVAIIPPAGGPAPALREQGNGNSSGVSPATKGAQLPTLGAPGAGLSRGNRLQIPPHLRGAGGRRGSADRDSLRSWGGGYSPMSPIPDVEEEQGDLPHKKAAIMGMLDAFAGTLMVLGGVYTDGQTQILLLQAAIPITLLLSVLLLRRKYHNQQYGGACTIIGAVCRKKTFFERRKKIIGKMVLVLSISFRRRILLSPSSPVLSKCMGVSGGAAAAAGAGGGLIFNAIFLCSNLPSALSTIYKEVAFSEAPGLSVNKIQFWVAFYQLFGNVIWCPIYTLSILGPSRVPLGEMSDILWNGFQCFLGYDMIKAPFCSDPNNPEAVPGLKPCDHCEPAFGTFSTYRWVIQLEYNHDPMLLVKHGSGCSI